MTTCAMVEENISKPEFKKTSKRLIPAEKLTFNFGLRWDLELPMTDRDNRFNYFDPTIPSPLIVPGLPNFMGGDVFQNPKHRGIIPGPFYREFQPRIGIAYRLTPKTVLRPGSGVFLNLYQFGPGEVWGLDGATASSPQLTTWNNDGATPWAAINNPYPNGVLMPPGSSLGAIWRPQCLGQSRSVRRD